MTYLSVLCVLLIVLTSMYYLSERAIIRSLKERDLKAVAELSESQLSLWYFDQMVDVRLIARSNMLSSLVSDLHRGGKEGTDTSLFQFLQQIGIEHDFQIISLFSTGGDLMMSAILNGASSDLANRALLKDAVSSGNTICSDFYFSQADQRNYIDFVSPVFDSFGTIIAVLCMKVDSDPFLQSLLSLWPLLEENTESYLVVRPLKSNALRYQPVVSPASASLAWMPVSEHDEISRLATSGISGHLNGTDYNQNKSLAYVKPIKATPWVLVVTMDMRELFADLNSRMFFVALIAFLVFVLCSFALLFAYKYRQTTDLKTQIDNERELRRYQEQFRTTMEALVEGVVTIDGSGRIGYMNKSASKMSGWSVRDAVGRLWSDVIQMDLCDHRTGLGAASLLTRLPSCGEKIFHASLLPREGMPFWALVSVTSAYFDNNGVSGTLISIMDISRQKAAEQKVRERELRFKQLVAELHDAVWTGSADGLQIFDVNDEFERIYGKSIEELKANPRLRDELVHPDDKELVKASNQALIQHGKSDTEYRIVRPDRRTVWVRDRKSVVYDEMGSAIYLGGIITDISASKMYESQLIAAKEKAESNEKLKTAFLSNMSHEIRTPLNCILGFTQILGSGGLSDEEVREYSGYIGQSGNRLLAMLSNIMELSRIESGVEPVSLSEFLVNELLEQIYHQFALSAQKKQLQFRLDLPPHSNHLTIRSDIVRLDRVLSNLVGNAIKYTKVGSVSLGYKMEAEKLELFVQDTGIGIPKEESEHIFERFFQSEASMSSEYEGVGLGLALCKELASSLGGQLHFISEPGRGSTFFLTIHFPVS